MAENLSPRPSLTPQQVDWLPWQLAVHAGPALENHIRLMQRYRAKIETMLSEPAWSATQRNEATAILDQLARLGIIYAGAEDGHCRDEEGRFIGSDDDD